MNIDDLFLWIIDLLFGLNMDVLQEYRVELTITLACAIAFIAITNIIPKYKKKATPDEINETGSTIGKVESKKYRYILIIAVLALIAFSNIQSCSFSDMGTDDSTTSLNDDSEKCSLTVEEIVKSNIDTICKQIEQSFSSLSFEKGSITTETGKRDTSTMSAQIYDLRLGNEVYLYQDRNTEKYTALFIPIHFSMNVNQTFTFDKQILEDVVGYARITINEIDSQIDFTYKVINYLSAQYFMSEKLLYTHLCGNGYIVQTFKLS